MSSAICALEVCKSFNGRPVLENFNLTVEAQESVALMGQSGSGKSVFLKCLLGLYPCDRGTLTIGPYSISRESAKMQEDRFACSGVVFQSYALFDSLTVWENVAFHSSAPLSQRRDHAISVLERVELKPGVADLYPSEISGGMKRRVSIARAIMHSPSYLFFDEPTEGLDPVFSFTISHLIREVVTQLKATAITITHNLQNACTIADRIVLLDQGQIAWQGPPQHVREASYPLMQDFLKSQWI
jgi:phospholipid/cholesterol/gamma-HCH transport system ATP-binding protein